ncbi:hypothetical protein K7711_33910 [Nocardia sp. CA2R105]|uniref:hypothetical protein n=1 Tax=Nocardia coffeae TaxID=2873381 RepID=UPI001CA76512|nr:hypothetical protein [Nocardia coffeae]MBY8861514.1 hypothetical protein [Nocardia coffeae]
MRQRSAERTNPNRIPSDTRSTDRNAAAVRRGTHRISPLIRITVPALGVHMSAWLDGMPSGSDS